MAGLFHVFGRAKAHSAVAHNSGDLQPRDGSGFRWYLVLVFLSSMGFCSRGRGDLTSFYSGSRLLASPTKVERKGERKNQKKRNNWQNKKGETYENFTQVSSTRSTSFYDWSICHGRYRRSMLIHLLENTVGIDGRHQSIVEINRSTSTVDVGSYKKNWSTVDIDRRRGLILKKLSF